jgi:hypothetical protein
MKCAVAWRCSCLWACKWQLQTVMLSGTALRTGSSGPAYGRLSVTAQHGQHALPPFPSHNCTVLLQNGVKW